MAWVSSSFEADFSSKEKPSSPCQFSFFFLFMCFGKPIQLHFNPKYNLRNFEMIELVHDSLAQ